MPLPLSLNCNFILDSSLDSCTNPTQTDYGLAATQLKAGHVLTGNNGFTSSLAQSLACMIYDFVTLTPPFVSCMLF